MVVIVAKLFDSFVLKLTFLIKLPPIFSLMLLLGACNTLALNSTIPLEVLTIPGIDVLSIIRCILFSSS
jgi:hypothetical protein